MGYIEDPPADCESVRCSKCQYNEYRPIKNQDNFHLLCYYNKTEISVRRNATCKHASIPWF